MKSRRYRRKSRKMRKQKKSRRGGATDGMIQYTVAGMDPNTRYPLRFNPSMALAGDIGMLKKLFIAEVNGHKDPEPDDYDTLAESVAIHLIRGETNDVVYQGMMDDWNDADMRMLIESLIDNDKLHIELA